MSDIVPDILHNTLQAGLVLPLDKEAAGIITSSEAILKELASKRSPSLTASATNALTKDIPKDATAGLHQRG